MRKIFILFALCTSVAIMATEGALSGRFTINENGDQVVFSQGNLQYQASTNTWRFAENQYDAIGSDNSKISVSYNGWIDLYGWGTSGYDNTGRDPLAVNYQPWSKSITHLKMTATIIGVEIESINCEMQHITGKCDTTWTGGGKYSSDDVNDYGYGPSTCMADKNLTGTSANYDWGVYNKISNGSNQKGKWRTLTDTEWDYIFNKRPLAQYLRSQATVCGVHGYMLLPDDFVLPDGMNWSNQTKNWETNNYDVKMWNDLEKIGAVFLPVTSGRSGTNVELDINSEGRYWSSSYSDQYRARIVYFNSNSEGRSNGLRYYGRAVRLVKEAENEQETPTAVKNADIRMVTRKVVCDGQMLIEREGKTYNVQGQEVK